MPQSTLPPTGSEFFVSPDGTKDGDGSKARTWDLQTALNQPAAVQPGDTIWVAGGRYTGAFVGRLVGTPDAPIKVRAAPGERVTLDNDVESKDDVLHTDPGAPYAWYWGMEITSSRPNHESAQRGSFVGMPTGVHAHGKGNKYINLVVHDATASGLDNANWNQSSEQEFYGCIVYYNGWTAPDRGHGHGIYLQNASPLKTIADNIFFRQFGYGIHVYGSRIAHIENIDITGNICFENGALARRPSPNLLVTGGGNGPTNIKVTDNCTYTAKPAERPSIRLVNIKDLVLRGNYFAQDGLAVTTQNPAQLSGNTVIGPAEGLTAENGNSLLPARPTGTKIIVRPNKYEPGARAHIVVYNWDNKDTVSVDLAPSGIAVGSDFEIRDVQNLYGTPVLAGKYNGGAVNLPMKLTEVAKPTGKVPTPPVHTPPEFNVFVIVKTAK